MDDRRIRISLQQRYQRICAVAGPFVIEARDAAAFATDPRPIIGAMRRAPETVERWRQERCSCDDHEMLERGMLLYDALYAWCRSEVGHAR